MSVIGLIPAAGHAQRLQPLSGSKELLRVGGRPVMDYLVDRMRAGGAELIVVVTRAEKEDVADHARSLDLEVVTGSPPSVSASLLLGLEHDPEAEVCLLGFPDTLWEPRDGFVLLAERLGDDADIVLGVFESPEPERSDVVVLDGARVASVDVKPSTPRSSLIWGCAAAKREALSALEAHAEPGDLFAELAAADLVRGVRLSGTMIDIGTEEALGRARSLLGA